MTGNVMTRSLMCITFWVAILGSSLASAVAITPGNLGLSAGNPDLQSNFLNFDFTAGSLSIQSAFPAPGEYTVGGLSENVFDNVFSISGVANAVDATLNLLITGEVASIGGGNQTLLSGDLIAWSNSATGVFNFIFGNLSGVLASAYGSQAGVNFTDGSLAGFDFTNNASVIFSGNADTISTSYSVPEPGSLGLGLLGMLMLACSKRRKLSN